MKSKQKTLKPAPQVEAAVSVNSTETTPPDIAQILANVDGLLRAGQVARALTLLSGSNTQLPWIKNALGVCQLRQGNAKVAVELFRGLVLATGGLIMRRDVPTTFKTNYVTALLLSGNLIGGQEALKEVNHEPHLAVGKLTAAIRRWVSGMSFWQRVNWWMGGEPANPFVLDFPPGELE